MNLPSELVSSFVKATKDTEKTSNESTVYGVVKNDANGKPVYVQIDGSDQYTPISRTANVTEGDRVVVLIKDHSATIIGNISAPSATTNEVTTVGDQITKLEILVADKIDAEELTAEIARIDTLYAQTVEIKGELEAQSATIDQLEAEDVVIKNSLTAATARIDKLESTSITTDVLDAKYATIEKLEAVEADIYNLDATFGDFEELTTTNFDAINADITKLKAKDAEIDSLVAKKATISELEAAEARIGVLEANSLTADSAEIKNLQADVADIDTLIFGSASGDTIHVSFANAVIAQLADAQIKSAMIDSVSANKITSGDIITNNVRVLSEDGKLLISDETIQISDDTRVRVQIGKDAVGDYSINIWDTDGNLMFSEGGITDSAIKEAIIRDDMVSETANIAATKLNIESLFNVINNDGSNTLNASKIKMDAEGQTLDVSFTKMTTDVETAQATADAAQAAANQNASDMAAIVTNFNADIDGLQTQIDGSITTWFYEVAPTAENEPAVNWTTTDLKNVHLGDLYYDTITGYCYRWQVKNNTYSWQRITDTDVTKALADAQTAQDTADQKRRVFYSQPAPPYDLGDLWVQGSDGDILRCQVAKTSSQSYSLSDWVIASKYTDDTAADAAQATANQNTSDINILKTTVSSQGTDISVIQGQITSKVWQQDINTAKNEMSTQYSSLEQEVDGISATVAGHTTQIGNKADSSTVTTVTNRVTALETDLDGFQATVSNTYATKTEVDDITIGGRNLLTDSVGEFDGSIINPKSPEFMRPGHDLYPIFEEHGLVEYTLSMDIKSADTSNNSHIQVYCQNGSGSYHSFNSGVNVTTEWQRLSVTFIPTVDENYTTDKRSLLAFYGKYDTGNIPIVKNLKLEVGNKATAWTPAPEDLMTYSDDAAETAKTEALDSVTETLTNYATLEITDSKISTAVSNSETTTKAYTDGKVSTALSSAYSYTDQTADSITSSVASTYTTIEDFQNLSIGGRNLLRDSKLITLHSNNSAIYPISCVLTTEDDIEFYRIERTDFDNYPALSLSLYASSPKATFAYAEMVGKQVTLSFKARTSREIVGSFMNNTYGSGTYVSFGKDSETYTTEWKTFYVVIDEFPEIADDGGIRWNPYLFQLTEDDVGTFYLDVREWKFELGNKPTDWTPAPEDVDVRLTDTEARITEAETSIVQNANSITSLATRTTTIEGRIGTAESSITQNANSITSLVSRTSTVEDTLSSQKIGGRNLLSNSEAERWTTRFLSIDTYDILADYIGEPVTISFDARYNEDNGGIAREITVYPYQNNGISIANYSGYTLTNEWARFSLTTTVKDWGINDTTYTPGSIGFYDYTGTNYYGIRRIKIELGNIPTDWTPAPEDMATAKDNDTAQATAENAQATADTAQTLVQQLSDNISMLVTDGNGTSLMTQTEDGWIFSTAEIQTAVDATSEGLSDLSTELGDTNNTVDVLKQAVNDLGEIAEYVKIGTYDDEPCIELGEADSDFKLFITNTRILFMEGSSIVAHITNQSLHIKKAVVEEELQQGGFVWQVRSNGNMGLVWKGVSS